MFIVSTAGSWSCADCLQYLHKRSTLRTAALYGSLNIFGRYARPVRFWVYRKNLPEIELRERNTSKYNIAETRVYLYRSCCTYKTSIVLRATRRPSFSVCVGNSRRFYVRTNVSIILIFSSVGRASVVDKTLLDPTYIFRYIFIYEHARLP